MGCGASASQVEPAVEPALVVPEAVAHPQGSSETKVEKQAVVATVCSREELVAKPPDRIRWRKGDLIGTGANGRVYLGLEEDTGAIIAVKEIMFSSALHDREELEQMQEEIELLRTLTHPNIVTYLGTDVNDDDQTLYIFTEWVPGGSIQALVTKFGRLGEVIVRKYVAQLLVGLAYLHGENVVHRDIKAANILVDDRGTIKLADFGSSKRVDAGGTMGSECHSLRGTPYFMAPEVIMQTGHGRKADVWSVGCTILQMVTGQPPWKSLQLGTPAALMFHIANATEPPPMPPEMSPELHSFLLACFQRDVDKRPSAVELLRHPFVVNGGAAAEAIASAQRGLAAAAAAPPAIEAPPPFGAVLPQADSPAVSEGVTLRLPPASPKAISEASIEEAADQTLARQSTRGRRGDGDAVSSATDMELDGFAMPAAAQPGRRVSGARPDQDEALITMFITREATTQLQGADKHFPGRPLTAQPRGAPPPRTAHSRRERRDGDDGDATWHGPRAPRPRGSDSRPPRDAGSYRDEKSPLLMAELPARRPQHGSTPTNTQSRALASRGRLSPQPAGRPVAWDDPAGEFDDGNMRSHDDRPINTEAARRDREAVVSKRVEQERRVEEQLRKKKEFEAEIERYKRQERHDGAA
ncbi:kinase-like domain-containing protein [Pelagophyceae sp. CCMP2097]|nr:kinase-like domain-containing protein [Pelagophyceae sp. CCMP2097]